MNISALIYYIVGLLVLIPIVYFGTLGLFRLVDKSTKVRKEKLRRRNLLIYGLVGFIWLWIGYTVVKEGVFNIHG